MTQRVQFAAPGDAGESVRALDRFLTRFGYLEREGSPQGEVPFSPTFDDDLVEAIVLYQRLHGLPETGALDELTLRWMNTPRCGVADGISGLEFAPALLGGGWPDGRATYHIDVVNEVPVLGGDSASLFRGAVETALSTWAAVGGLIFTLGFPGKIFVAFRRGDHGDDSPDLVFDDQPGSVLGHAFKPNHPRFPGSVHLDAGEQWTLGAPTNMSADLPTVLLHEIGHAIGLEHVTQDPSAVMHERFELGGQRRSLGQADIEALRRVYPT